MGEGLQLKQHGAHRSKRSSMEGLRGAFCQVQSLSIYDLQRRLIEQPIVKTFCGFDNSLH